MSLEKKGVIPSYTFKGCIVQNGKVFVPLLALIQFFKRFSYAKANELIRVFEDAEKNETEIAKNLPQVEQKKSLLQRWFS